MKYSFGLLLGLAAAVSLGCGGADKPPPYANVAGKVTFNGKDIPKGTITFATDGRPPSVIDIIDGKFSGQAMTGSNKISISYRAKTAQTAQLPPDVLERLKYEGRGQQQGNPNAAPATEAGTVEMIPPEWGANSKQMRVVESGAANSFEFDIKAK